MTGMTIKPTAATRTFRSARFIATPAVSIGIRALNMVKLQLLQIPKGRAAMTDRFSYITVALERDIREDDAEALLNAIRMMRGVLAVEPQITTPEVWTATERAKRELEQKIWEVLYPTKPTN
jgi:hypothetical protein